MKTRNAVLAVLALSNALLGATPPAQDSAAALIARIEAPQTPNRQGWDPYSIQQLMERFGVPGMSLAVIKDGQIDMARAYGQADVTAKSAGDDGDDVSSRIHQQAGDGVRGHAPGRCGQAVARRRRQPLSEIVEGARRASSPAAVP